MAHPIEGTHQHAKSGKVYNYRAEYRTEGEDIRWRAEVSQEGATRARPDGVIHAGTPAADAIAPGAVTDAVVKAIDDLDDGDSPL